jgi:hypothetical protein
VYVLGMIAEATKTEHIDRLTAKQALFVDRYVLSLNGALAAREAGYSPKIARNQAAENMAKPHIRAAIEAKLHALKPDLRLTPEKLRERVSKIVHDESLRPDTQLKAIELAGKMTPGTFEPAPPTTQINFTTVLAKFNNMPSIQLDNLRHLAAGLVPYNREGSVTPSLSCPRPSPSQCDTPSPSASVPLPTSSSVHNDIIVDSVESNKADQPASGGTPQATPLDRDTDTPKIVVQNQVPPHLLHSPGSVDGGRI